MQNMFSLTRGQHIAAAVAHILLAASGVQYPEPRLVAKRPVKAVRYAPPTSRVKTARKVVNVDAGIAGCFKGLRAAAIHDASGTLIGCWKPESMRLQNVAYKKVTIEDASVIDFLRKQRVASVFRAGGSFIGSWDPERVDTRTAVKAPRKNVKVAPPRRPTVAQQLELQNPGFPKA